jgi:hypothetical protein
MTTFAQVLLIICGTIVALAALNTIDIVFGKNNKNNEQEK